MVKHKYLRIVQPKGQQEEPFNWTIDLDLFNCDGVTLANFTIYTEHIRHGFKSYYEYDYSSYKQLAEYLDKTVFKLANAYKFPYFDNRDYIFKELMNHS